MRKELEHLEELLKKAKGALENQHRCTYPDEETALHHLSLVAQMQRGQFVTYKNEDGELVKGVFFGMDDSCRCNIVSFDVEDNGHKLQSIPPVNIVFEN